MDFVNYDYSNKVDEQFKKYIEKNMLFLTPHIAGNTYEALSETSNIVFKKFLKRIKAEK